MFNIDYKIQNALEDRLLQSQPREKLEAFAMGTERLNFWLEFLLLGPVAGAIGMRNFYIGLTTTRIVLLPLSWWANKPTDDASEISLGRVSDMRFKQGILTGKLTICYGEDVKRAITIPRVQFRNTRHFLDTYSALPKPSLTDEEIKKSRIEEEAYKGERRDRVTQAVVALVAILFLVILCNVIALNS